MNIHDWVNTLPGSKTPGLSDEFPLFCVIRRATLTGLAAVLLWTTQAVADEPKTIDDLGFGAVTDNQLFSSGFKIKGKSIFNFGDGESALIETNLEAESNSILPGFSDKENENLDHIASGYQSQGLKIKRLSTSWHTETGTLTVGNDWANFQDILGAEENVSRGFSDSRNVASQIKWVSSNGFSVSLEDSPQTEIYSPGNSLDSEFGSSPSLILSWQGGAGGTDGKYRISAMGKKLDANAEGQVFDGSDVIGWGLNLEGGWQIGELFAALSVTYGKGISSYVLQRYGNDILVTPNEFDIDSEALSIRPSLYFRLNDSSNFHVALGRYSSQDPSTSSGIDTLDTIHMGYSWSPWPSTHFGFELVGQNAGGPNIADEESTQLKFGAQKRF